MILRVGESWVRGVAEQADAHDRSADGCGMLIAVISRYGGELLVIIHRLRRAPMPAPPH
ncbi:hypothetical protein [Streptomyces sp. NRRL F-5650]|uniref:hypothetical protein n=1 Tax=Streptomyces sp. NRRL F-5650 TaxID=1463868 RepID=UPI000B1320CD|nr:hypothetical protein [Streptomyces sp. NRRL F-5650]